MRRSGVFVAAVMACMVLLSGAAFAKTVEFKFAHSGSLEHKYHIGAEYFKTCGGKVRRRDESDDIPPGATGRRAGSC